jgi:hypothetical protein
MATISSYSIRFDQRNSGNTAYSERYVSGSNLVLVTDAVGVVTGSSTVPSSSYSLTASYAINAGNALLTGSSYPITSSWAYDAISSSYAATASYLVGATANKIISPDTQTSVTANNGSISGSVSGVALISVLTQSNVSEQNNSGSFTLQGRYSGSNINVGIPQDAYSWGSSLSGSYFSTWNSDTNVSDMFRFLAGALSASYPLPTPNTKTFAGITTANVNTGSSVTINGRVPSGSTNPNIIYLQNLGWTNSGSTLFSGYTFKSGSAYMIYSSSVGGSTLVSSSLGSPAFGLGLLTNNLITLVSLSGSFKLTFASSSIATVNYTNNQNVVFTQQNTENSTPSISNPIAVKIVPSANMAIIPPVYQDGYFYGLTGSNLTNSVSLNNISSSGIYIFSASVGVATGSSLYSFFTGSTLTYYYTPLKDADFTQSISAINSSLTAITAFSRSLSGVPYLTSGSTYRYVITASGIFNPLYYNGLISNVNIPSNELGLATINSSSLTTNPTIATAGIVKSSDYSITRAVGTYPSESDIVVFDVTLTALGTGSTATSAGAISSSFIVNDTSYNRAGSGTTIGSQTVNIHTSGSFGQPISSGSLLYFGRLDSNTSSSLTFSTVPNTERLLDETYRRVLDNNLLTMTGTSFDSSSLLTSKDLQVKPGYLVNPGGTHRYWYPLNYGDTYKYYVRHFKAVAVTSQFKITLTGNTTLVAWDNLSTADSIAIGIIFESGNSNNYGTCRLFDIANLANNVVSASVPPTAGKNPFGVNIDLYGNNGSGASNSGGVIIFPTRAVDGAELDSTVAGKDELYLIVRYNGSPTPLTSIKIEKTS